MLWLWDQSEIVAALTKNGLASESVRTMAETVVLARPTGNGSRVVPCHEGVDEQTLANGAIVGSQWMNNAASTTPLSPLLPRAWGWDLIGHSGLSLSASGRDRTLHMRQAGMFASFALAAAGIGYAAYWGSLLWRLESQRDALQITASEATQQLGDVASLQRTTAQDRDWVETYQRLGLSVRWAELIDALGPALERYGVVVREMEVRQDDVRLSVVTAGSAIDLPGLLLALSGVPGVEDVQLRMNIDVSQATFSFRAAGYMQTADRPRAAQE